MASNNLILRILGEDKASDILKNIQANAEALEKKTGDLAEGFKKAGDSLTSLGTKLSIAGAAITGAFGLALKNTIDYGEQLYKLNSQTGIAVGTLAKLGYAAEQESANMEELATGLKFLQRNMSEAVSGNAQAQKAFTYLGISVTDNTGRMKNANEVLMEVAQAFKGIPDEATKTAVAMDLFGRSGNELVPFLNLGPEKIKELGEEAEKTGKVWSESDVKAAKAFSDQITYLQKSIAGLVQTIGKDLIPMLAPLIDKLATTIQQVRQWTEKNPELTKAILAIAGGLGTFLTIAGPFLLIVGTISKTIGALITVFGAASSAIAFIASPLGVVIGVMALAVIGGIELYRNWDRIKEGANSLAIALKNFGSSIYGYIVDGFNKAIDWIKNLPSQMYQAGKDFFSSWLKGLLDTINSVKDKLRDLANEIFKFFGGGHSPAQVGPLSNLEVWGARLITSYLDGIKKTAPILEGGIVSLLDSIQRKTATTSFKISPFTLGPTLPSAELPKIEIPKIEPIAYTSNLTRGIPEIYQKEESLVNILVNNMQAIGEKISKSLDNIQQAITKPATVQPTTKPTEDIMSLFDKTISGLRGNIPSIPKTTLYLSEEERKKLEKTINATVDDSKINNLVSEIVINLPLSEKKKLVKYLNATVDDTKIDEQIAQIVVSLPLAEKRKLFKHLLATVDNDAFANLIGEVIVSLPASEAKKLTQALKASVDDSAFADLVAKITLSLPASEAKKFTQTLKASVDDSAFADLTSNLVLSLSALESKKLTQELNVSVDDTTLTDLVAELVLSLPASEVKKLKQKIDVSINDNALAGLVAELVLSLPAPEAKKLNKKINASINDSAFADLMAEVLITIPDSEKNKLTKEIIATIGDEAFQNLIARAYITLSEEEQKKLNKVLTATLDTSELDKIKNLIVKVALENAQAFAVDKKGNVSITKEGKVRYYLGDTPIDLSKLQINIKLIGAQLKEENGKYYLEIPTTIEKTAAKAEKAEKITSKEVVENPYLAEEDIEKIKTKFGKKTLADLLVELGVLGPEFSSKAIAQRSAEYGVTQIGKWEAAENEKLMKQIQSYQMLQGLKQGTPFFFLPIADISSELLGQLLPLISKFLIKQSNPNFDWDKLTKELNKPNFDWDEFTKKLNEAPTPPPPEVTVPRSEALPETIYTNIPPVTEIGKFASVGNETALAYSKWLQGFSTIPVLKDLGEQTEELTTRFASLPTYLQDGVKVLSNQSVLVDHLETQWVDIQNQIAQNNELEQEGVISKQQRIELAKQESAQLKNILIQTGQVKDIDNEINMLKTKQNEKLKEMLPVQDELKNKNQQLLDLNKKITEEKEKLQKLQDTDMYGSNQKEIQALQTMINEDEEQAKQLEDQVNSKKSVVDSYSQEIEDIKKVIDLLETVKSKYPDDADIDKTINELKLRMTQLAGDWGISFGNTLREAFAKVIQGDWKPALEQLTNFFREKLLDKLVDIFTESDFYKQITKLVGDIGNVVWNIQPRQEKLIQEKNQPTAASILSADWSKIISGLQSAWTGFTSAISSAGSSLAGLANSAGIAMTASEGTAIVAGGLAAALALLAAVVLAAYGLFKLFQAGLEKIWARVQEIWGRFTKLIDQMVSSLFSPLVDAVGNVLIPLLEALAMVTETILTLFKPSIDITASILNQFADWLKSGLEGLAESLNAFIHGVGAGIGGLGAGIANFGAWLGDIGKPLQNLGNALILMGNTLVNTNINLEDINNAINNPQAGGVQISEITGPTRDLLVELLSPLKSLDILPGLFDTMRDAILQMRDAFLSTSLPKTAVAGETIVNVYVDHLGEDYTADKMVDDISKKLGARINIMRARGGR